MVACTEYSVYALLNKITKTNAINDDAIKTMSELLEQCRITIRAAEIKLLESRKPLSLQLEGASFDKISPELLELSDYVRAATLADEFFTTTKNMIHKNTYWNNLHEIITTTKTQQKQYGHILILEHIIHKLSKIEEEINNNPTQSQ